MFQPQNALKHHDGESFEVKISKTKKSEKLTVDQAKTAGGDTLFGEWSDINQGCAPWKEIQ